MRLVIIKSPYAGDVAANVAYLTRCIHDSLTRGEAPIASHRMYPGTLDDSIKDQRSLGLKAGHAWYRVADACVVYLDRGVSDGMILGIEYAVQHGVKVEYRRLEKIT